MPAAVALLAAMALVLAVAMQGRSPGGSDVAPATSGGADSAFDDAAPGELSDGVAVADEGAAVAPATAPGEAGVMVPPPADGADVTERMESGALPDVAQRVLEGYRSQGRVALVESGYLDLLGRAWGCVVSGPGWSEVCVVSEGPGEGQSKVRVARMEGEQWKDVAPAS